MWHLTCAATFSVNVQLMAIIAGTGEGAGRIDADLFTLPVISPTLVNICYSKAASFRLEY